ncbi:unnamed protein product [Cylicocyclus nassatus]|uniref:Rhodopsin n=1 Tax=Cylicocyclus nassatus TaxID=53992 RepID=A0AA36M9L6_CYLNA|nr:unnamed protein product [Cylicocyclus nassatus]
MHVFYLHLPWRIDEEEYNCSSRPLSEWQNRGSYNYAQGIYFSMAGTIFIVLYVLCLVGMYRGHLLRIPCYRLMLINGFADIADLVLTSYVTAYFHFTGGIFCSSKNFEWIAGHLAYSLWFGASFNCMVLAFNRLVEMVPAARSLGFFFEGKVLYMWTSLSIFYMIIVWFVLRPIPFNTVISAFIGPPMIGDPEWEHQHYTSAYLLFYNLIVTLVMLTVYPYLCWYVRKVSVAHGNVDKAQMQIFTQVLCVCVTTAIAALLYASIELLPSVPRVVIIAAHVLWHLSHGMHGVTYMCFNPRIRREVFALFKTFKTVPYTVSSTNQGF